jgi:hypothetical protein
MITVDARALPLLLDAAERELRRLGAIEETLDGSGDDWPPGFDSNDLPLYEIAIRAVQETIQRGSTEVDLSGKILWFLLDLIPDYVRDNAKGLSLDQYDSLKHVYAHQHEQRKVAFPEFNE